MNISLPQKQKKDILNRYYTSDLISSTLIHSLQNISPKQIIELGVGQGALTKAAINRWISARFITIDLDPEVGHVSTKKRPPLNLTHYTADVLQDNLHTQLGLELKSFDLAIGNPPFMKPEWRDHYSNILEDSGLSAAVSCHKEATSHILFLAQSLRLVRPEGKLGLILPDGIISGEKNYSLRKNLLENHHIEQVIKLPSRAFSKTEAQTHLLILTKESNQQSKTMLSSFKEDGKLSTPIFIEPGQGANRLDYDYHASQKLERKKNKKTTIRDLIGEQSLIRGSISSNTISDQDHPVFHLGAFSELTPSSNQNDLKVPKEFLITKAQAKLLDRRIKLAQKGDILVARVGRNLHRKVAWVSNGSCIISDCVYAIRPEPKEFQRILKGLTNTYNQNRKSSLARGVGAKYLTRADVFSLKV